MVATYYCKEEEVQLCALIQQENDMTQIKARKSICYSQATFKTKKNNHDYDRMFSSQKNSKLDSFSKSLSI